MQKSKTKKLKKIIKKQLRKVVRNELIRILKLSLQAFKSRYPVGVDQLDEIIAKTAVPSLKDAFNKESTLWKMFEDSPTPLGDNAPIINLSTEGLDDIETDKSYPCPNDTIYSLYPTLPVTDKELRGTVQSRITKIRKTGEGKW